jgi:hypothetical protein
MLVEREREREKAAYLYPIEFLNSCIKRAHKENCEAKRRVYKQSKAKKKRRYYKKYKKRKAA